MLSQEGGGKGQEGGGGSWGAGVHSKESAPGEAGCGDGAGVFLFSPKLPLLFGLFHTGVLSCSVTEKTWSHEDAVQ